MTPADIDPSLRAEPVLETLEDGFSPPPAEAPGPTSDSPLAGPQARPGAASPPGSLQG